MRGPRCRSRAGHPRRVAAPLANRDHHRRGHRHAQRTHPSRQRPHQRRQTLSTRPAQHRQLPGPHPARRRHQTMPNSTRHMNQNPTSPLGRAEPVSADRHGESRMVVSRVRLLRRDRHTGRWENHAVKTNQQAQQNAGRAHRECRYGVCGMGMGVVRAHGARGVRGSARPVRRRCVDGNRGALVSHRVGHRLRAQRGVVDQLCSAAGTGRCRGRTEQGIAPRGRVMTPAEWQHHQDHHSPGGHPATCAACEHQADQGES